MTDGPVPPPLTPDEIDARRARSAARTTAPRPGRRRHPAQGARIAAAGLGATTMLGLVGAMALSPPSVPVPPPAPSTVPAGAVVVGDGAGTAATTASTRPTVRPAPAAPTTPAASTSGSH